MIVTLSDLLLAQAAERPHHPALIETRAGSRTLSYGALAEAVTAAAATLCEFLSAGDRLLLWLDKRLETVTVLAAANRCGALFVLANPVLKPEQVVYLVHDCQPRAILTTHHRAPLLTAALDPDWRPQLLPPALRELLAASEHDPPVLLVPATTSPPAQAPLRFTENDPAAIFYTSGSTGLPKGVVVSHRNLVVGAQAVVHYLGLTAEDRILALLPLSFDAGFSQLTTAWVVGATVVLHDYLLPGDAVRVLAQNEITALTAVPPLWRQLLNLPWPAAIGEALRLGASTGGKMPPAWVSEWQQRVPAGRFFVMYGLTEAFRATYLPPEVWAERPESIGIPIPNNDLLILREDGTRCAPGEVGEIVQRGPLVALGYWNDPVRTAERFRPLPPGLTPGSAGLVRPEVAVFSGDYGYVDEAGFFYFVGRRDAQIKTSGYRVSPEEIESVVLRLSGVVECCACGVDDPQLGQRIALWAAVAPECGLDEGAILAHCRAHLANFQMPAEIRLTVTPLPRNANGKIDRQAVAQAFSAPKEPTR